MAMHAECRRTKKLTEAEKQLAEKYNMRMLHCFVGGEKVWWLADLKL